MLPAKVAMYPSRNPRDSFRWHEVWEHPDGSLTCTCPAGERGVECWAIQKVKGQRKVESILRMVPKKLDEPDQSAWMKKCIEVAQQGLREWGAERRANPISIKDQEAYAAKSVELHRISAEQATKRHWDNYYKQFVPENQNGK